MAVVRHKTYGSALNEIAALRRRNEELEAREQRLLSVLDEARDAIRGLNAILPEPTEAVAS